MDVARKVIILGRVAGLDLTQETLQVENIVPEALRTTSASAFMDTLPQFDQHFADLNDEATKAGQVLRYVGLVDPVEGKSSVTLAR
jgi:homoserine dehydrogenase